MVKIKFENWHGQRKFHIIVFNEGYDDGLIATCDRQDDAETIVRALNVVRAIEKTKTEKLMVEYHVAQPNTPTT